MKFKRRCRNCGKRGWIKVIRRGRKTYCICPHCKAEGEFYPNKRLREKFVRRY